MKSNFVWVLRARGELIQRREGRGGHAIGQMLGIDLALVRGDDEDEADALARQPVMQMVEAPRPGIDFPLAKKLEARMLLDVVAPVEPIVLAQQRDPIAAARQADREIQPVGGRQQIGPQAEVIRDIGIDLRTRNCARR